MSVDLRVDWCSYEAAKYAVEHWHYSKRLTSTYARPVYLGAWEDGLFVGSVVFSHGANRNIGSPYGLTHIGVCELVRVALRQHVSFATQVVSMSIKRIKQHSPGMRLIVSYADTEQGHVGSIYQAGNWVYVGESPGGAKYEVKGRQMHQRAVDISIGTREGLIKIDGMPKHKYLYPLDRAMRKQIAPLAKPYPKREPCEQSVEGDTVGDQPTETGSIPVVRFDATGAVLIEPVIQVETS